MKSHKQLLLLTIQSIALLTMTKAEVFVNERVLQATVAATNTTKTSLPVKYPENVTIPFTQSLGCGACIKGGYIFCAFGKEGNEYATTLPTTKCCQNSTNCPEATNSNYTCSNAYADKTYSKFVCPFVKANCGNYSNLNFTKTGE